MPPIPEKSEVMMEQIPEIAVRPAVESDREQVFAVEAKSTPGLRYLPHVFEQFLADERGEFLVAEMAGAVVACGKFTVVPDGSAWLETLRVIPERQGLGIGKRFYARFFTIAAHEGVTTMRMYTGTQNVVSKGLAERFGFQPTETFYGAGRAAAVKEEGTADLAFERLTEPAEATARLMAHAESWQHFLVMNRTFYRLTPALCAALAAAGQVYSEPASASVIALGARFMPEQVLHIGLWGGDTARCLRFALQQADIRGVPRVSCLFPTAALAIQAPLLAQDFALEASPFIVMEANFPLGWQKSEW